MGQGTREAAGKYEDALGRVNLIMNICFFCGPTERPLTEEHVWPQWVSGLLLGKYGSVSLTT